MSWLMGVSGEAFGYFYHPWGSCFSCFVNHHGHDPTVVALREIAEGQVTLDLLDEPEPEPEPELIPEHPLDLADDFRAPQLGMGD